MGMILKMLKERKEKEKNRTKQKEENVLSPGWNRWPPGIPPPDTQSPAVGVFDIWYWTLTLIFIFLIAFVFVFVLPCKPSWNWSMPLSLLLYLSLNLSLCLSFYLSFCLCLYLFCVCPFQSPGCPWGSWAPARNETEPSGGQASLFWKVEEVICK